ncbi:hypothetical protein [Flexithrix dorotheae]|uniref:hypothetical protein n=1 Tax=Flexithrix dorotheae TaxID=70993 RepID=UPI000378CB42|nr:hypothetical protein [Flexithrix dorotheae]
MSGNFLHILNGDSTLFQIQKTKITGDTLVWREVLCEGPVSEDIVKSDFWIQRLQFFSENYQVDAEAFHEKTIKEIEKLDKCEKYDEVVLWFEYDLFCQINLLGALALIYQKKLPSQPISLISIGEVSGYKKLVGLGEIDAKIFPDLFENRIFLDGDDLKMANTIWAQYCSDNPLPLLDLADNAALKFPYLRPALEAHFKRFPSIFNGLSQTQQEILNFIQSEKIETERQLVGKMLRQENYYGFGDLQYFKTVDTINSLIEKNVSLCLSPLGEKVYAGKANFLSTEKNEFWLGGVKNNQFFWDETLNELIPNKSN